MGTTFSNADDVLKDFYWGDKVTPQMITATPLLSEIKTSKESIVSNVGGRQIMFPLRKNYLQGMGARGAGTTLPKARKQQFDKATFAIKKNIVRVEIEGEAWRSTGDAGPKAFLNLIRSEVNDAVESHAKDLNIQLYGDGTGARGVVVDVVPTSGSPVTAAGQHVFQMDDVRGLFPDMLLDVYTTSDVKVNIVSAAAVEVVVDDVDRINNQVTVTWAGTLDVGIEDGDVFYREGSKDLEMMGLDGIINDSTGLASFQGITVSGNSFWEATVLANSGTDRALTTDLMENSFNRVMEQNNMPADCIVTSYTQKRKYEQLLVSDKRFTSTNGRPVLDGGYERLAYNNVGMIFDTDCQEGRMYFLQKKFLKMFQQFGYEWVSSPDKTNIWDRVADYDKYEAVGIFEAEFGCTRRNVHAQLTDLDVT